MERVRPFLGPQPFEHDYRRGGIGGGGIGGDGGGGMAATLGGTAVSTAAPTAALDRRTAASRVAHARYLVVDDNIHMRGLIKDLLRGFGARDLAEAADGADALREIRLLRPDLLITDWRMTPLDGLDLVRILRTASDSPAPEIPVILVTGFSDLHLVMEARDAGVDEILVKPLAALDLWRRVVEALLRPRPFIRSAHYHGPCRRRMARGAAPYTGPERRKTAAGPSPTPPAPPPDHE